ncbi:sigma-54-dependent transcriptional regulator [Nocardioides cavernaquae]|uniref:Sigma-54-dependent Fis family transcriptional regulator n=1 Tax=Nocardioides cavernaquae TaxID=2321396 RepID=A0A3A5HA94_9ACTN|nr:sigma 54-interacting transcriptional regulator [Nocardioides cavernaquae]RJS47282.1 sigma-54-dependent Fis family transcriptional regulator [Nocardioides cavernaquae]
MATIIGKSDTVEVAHLRQALDSAGFPEGHDDYQVIVFDPARGDSCPVTARSRQVVVTPAAATAAAAWSLLRAGAEDVVGWDGAGTAVALVRRLERWRKVDAVLASPVVTDLFVGSSQQLRHALVELVELALFGSGPILLVGETGTGKELAARLVHAMPGTPTTGDLVVLDCTTIVPSLSGSELFGHERGAFTGADRSRAGAFAAADGGTLFLDEIGELPLPLQAELLRVIQEGTYKRVGGDVWARTSFRLVSATNRDLEAEQRAGRFRSDLYHRIASGVVRLPPLRERPSDVEPLFRHFLAEATHDAAPELSRPVAAMLHERAFPGNLRELRQLAYAVAACHCGAGPVTPGEIPARYRPETDATGPSLVRGALERAVRTCLGYGVSLPDLKAMVADLAVDVALTEHDGNAHRAATALGVTDRAIQLRKQVPKPRTAADQ